MLRRQQSSGLVCFLQVSSWGGYVFLINLIPLHVLVLMLTGRFSHRVYVAYCTVYCLGTILSMQISFVGFQVRLCLPRLCSMPPCTPPYPTISLRLWIHLRRVLLTS